MKIDFNLRNQLSSEILSSKIHRWTSNYATGDDAPWIVIMALLDAASFVLASCDPSELKTHVADQIMAIEDRVTGRRLTPREALERATFNASSPD